METELYYKRVMNSLRAKIISGEYKKGDYIASEEQLQEQYHVSRTTIRTAVRELIDEGLLKIARGKGTMVSYSALHSTPENMFSVFDEISNRGMAAKLGNIVIIEMEADKYIAQKLNVAVGEPILRIFRLMLADDAPFSQNYSFVPKKLLGSLTNDQIIKKLYKTGSFYRLLEEEYGIRIETINDAISAINGDDNNVFLNQEEGDAVLRIERVGYDTNNDPVEYSQTYIRGDRFTQHVTLKRK